MEGYETCSEQNYKKYVLGLFEKSMQSLKDDTSGAYWDYSQLEKSLGWAHTKFKSGLSIILCLTFVCMEEIECFENWIKKNFECWLNNDKDWTEARLVYLGAYYVGQNSICYWKSVK